MTQGGHNIVGILLSMSLDSILGTKCGVSMECHLCLPGAAVLFAATMFFLSAIYDSCRAIFSVQQLL